MGLFDKFAVGSNEKKSEELQDILQNLNSILNTKKHYGAPLGDLGMDDMNYHSSRGLLASKMAEQIKENVERYEPRLRIVSVEPTESENPLHLSFVLVCELRDKSQKLKVVFDSFSSVYSMEHAL
ncbi:GPW/gp25 family protein [Desulfonatronospira thiodismutans ASO3-1]|uniref:GPW/gp25 family protein n=1 Tax=Desulfonatronospira thiodismutans ASO3-1 TaxID=555779 RepID=D6SPQ1_9BACT|nr:type VI secretion system baseplate subunit TssE [Desulfonatronospira thiodismutans]EFI34727.1 GPW/gp25 family protein [Desulfonatronospira thiodismutans ASO3-1]